MAFATGSVTDFADLLLAVQEFAADNGWSLSGDVLHKGACYVELTSTSTTLEILGGTGVDVDNALTGAASETVHFGSLLTSDLITFPAQYSAHGFDTEIYVILHWGAQSYALLAFGSSPVDGLPGTGNWYAGSRPKGENPSTKLGWGNASQGWYGDGTYDFGVGLFWTGGYYNHPTAFVHTALDGGEWSGWGRKQAYQISASATACVFAGQLLASQPNAWNGQAVLVPALVAVGRPDNKSSLVLDLAHLRYVNITNLDPGQVVTLGQDRWRIYPFYVKGGPDPGDLDSGPLGYAIRYDGP